MIDLTLVALCVTTICITVFFYRRSNSVTDEFLFVVQVSKHIGWLYMPGRLLLRISGAAPMDAYSSRRSMPFDPVVGFGNGVRAKHHSAKFREVAGIVVGRAGYKALDDKSEASARPCIVVGVSFILIILIVGTILLSIVAKIIISMRSQKRPDA